MREPEGSHHAHQRGARRLVPADLDPILRWPVMVCTVDHPRREPEDSSLDLVQHGHVVRLPAAAADGAVCLTWRRHCWVHLGANGAGAMKEGGDDLHPMAVLSPPPVVWEMGRG